MLSEELVRIYLSTRHKNISDDLNLTGLSSMTDQSCTSNFPRFNITYLLTYSMVQSPSWEANRFAASQEIPRISRNPNVHYRTHKRPTPVPILGQPNPVHILTSHLLEIHPNIIHPSTPRSPQWSPSLRFPHQDPIHPPSPYPYAPHAQPSVNIWNRNVIFLNILFSYR